MIFFFSEIHIVTMTTRQLSTKLGKIYHGKKQKQTVNKNIYEREYHNVTVTSATTNVQLYN